MLQVTKLTYTPPSVKVSVQLLNDLEKFIFQDLPSILHLDEELIKKKYLVTISEPNVDLNFKSISDYQYQLLPEKTIKVSIGFDVRYWELKNHNNYEVYLFFSKEKSYSEVKINISEEVPSASVETIKVKINQILNQYKTLNSYFFLPSYLNAILILSIIIYGYLLYKKILSNFQPQALLFVVLLLTNSNIKPYSLFDTQNNNSKDKIVNWLLLIPLSAIILYMIKLMWGI